MTAERIALLGTDIQNAFGTNGEVAVPGAEMIVAPMNRAIAIARSREEQVYLSRDWHKEGSKHFKENGGAWEIHAEEGSESAKFLYGLDTEGAIVISKGRDINDPDGYSPFGDGITEDGVSFEEHLRESGITTLVGGGLIFNVCVKIALIDGAKRGFKTYLLEDAAAKLDLPAPNDNKGSEEQMKAAGVKFITVDDYARGL